MNPLRVWVIVFAISLAFWILILGMVLHAALQ